jgi:RNA polymerase sigma-70 factor (ECF subfamily)
LDKTGRIINIMPEMLEPPPELAPDLDWMLQSGQVSRDIIAEALVREYYMPVYHLALSILDNRDVASKATLDAFTIALTDIYRYRGQVAARQWLYAIVLHTCRKTWRWVNAWRTIQTTLPASGQTARLGDSLPENAFDAELWLAVDCLKEEQRLIVLLKYVHGWAFDEIAQVLEIEADWASNQLEEAHKRISQALAEASEEADLSQEESDPTRLEEQLWRSLGSRWPQESITPDELEGHSAQLGRQALQRAKRRRRVTAVRELALVAIAILLAVVSIWGVNIFSGGSDPTPTSIARVVETQLVYVDPPTVTPAAHQETATPRNRQEEKPSTSTPVPDNLFYTVRAKDTLPKIAAYLEVSVDSLRSLNRIPLGSQPVEGQRLLIPGQIEPAFQFTPTAVTPFSQPTDLLDDPVEAARSMRWRGWAFNTLWLDARVLSYGPTAYIGPAKTTRIQFWFGPNQALALSGPPGGTVEKVVLVNNGHIYAANPGSGRPWFSEWDGDEIIESSEFEIFESLFAALLDGENVLFNSEYEVVGNGEIAGRQTIIVEQYDAKKENLTRFWEDEETGVILRRQYYVSNELPKISQEVVVTNVAYDINFPQALFDPNLPWLGGFAMDYTGKPFPAEMESDELGAAHSVDRLPLMRRPEDFNFLKDRLTFQYSQDYHPEEAGMAKVDVFADSYFVKQATMGNPWTMICQRSADGERIAYVSQPYTSETLYTSMDEHLLHWFSLTNPRERAYVLNPGLVSVTQFAFAPDSRRMALFGYPSTFSNGVLYIVDLETNISQQVIELAEAKSLVWRPDGEQLALIARYAPDSYYEHLLVIRADSGRIVYNNPLDFSPNMGLNWPTTEWGVELPNEMGGMDACAEPPQEE